ncbi:hypothetical protein ACEWY4_022057 [Coilia grayii]|uniref:TRAF-type domain-containing protein n=1 Tax=Coilia grayii TaxID=363190 RepID=A0ABD1J5Z2_9TELE
MATALHSHCSTCVNLHCVEPARPGASCEVTSCPLKCGSSFHSCKGPEHRLLCPLEAVPCPSQCYGCPVSMPRARVAQHLFVCPASVVRCRHTHIPNIRPSARAHTHNTLTSHTLLDEHSSDTHAASDTQTSLTQMPCTQVSQTADLQAIQPECNGKNMPEETLHKRSKSIPNGEDLVLGNTVVNGLSDDLKQGVNEVSSTKTPIASAAGVMDIDVNQSDRGETYEGGSVTPEAHQSTSEADASWENECLTSHPVGDLDALPPCYDREARLQLLQRFLPQDLNVRLANSPANNSGPTQPTEQPMEVCLPIANCLGSVELGTAAVAAENVEVSQAEACCAQVPSSTTTSDAAVSPSQAPPSAGTETGSLGSSSLHQGYDEEPAGAMCGQLFRRDEFLWHSRNVHADLDLLEHACPLATYGCPVVQRQLSAPRDAHLVYYARPGALGLLPAPPDVGPDPQGLDRLSVLPVELQRHLLGYLDGFSLNQLAMTSSRMREVCAGLLRVRGMVILRWTRCCHGDNDDNNNKNRGAGCSGGDGGGVCRWKVQDKVWRFSNSFSRVESWDVVDAPSLSNHLQSCQWNQVERPLEARALPCMSGHAALIESSVRRSTLNWLGSLARPPK